MNSNLGARLQAARQGSGMSTRTLAEQLQRKRVDISHATIANYERGRTIPPLPIVAAIADICGLPVNWFLQTTPVLTNVCYRALKKVGMKDKRQFEANAQRWLEGYRKLETKLDQRLRNELAGFGPNNGENGQILAERLRKQLRLGERPVPSVVDVLHQFGVRVLSLDAPPAVDGLCGTLGSEQVVVLNSALSNDRFRLNAAHELGHHLYGSSFCHTIMTNPERERLAFEFASHFLLPASKLRAAFDGYSMLRLIEYKKQYGISLGAMIYRAHKENLLSTKVYRMLWREFAKRGWRRTEPGEVSADRPFRFEQMLESAIRSNALTWSTAANVTGIHEGELRKRLTMALDIWAAIGERRDRK